MPGLGAGLSTQDILAMLGGGGGLPGFGPLGGLPTATGPGVAAPAQAPTLVGSPAMPSALAAILNQGQGGRQSPNDLANLILQSLA